MPGKGAEETYWRHLQNFEPSWDLRLQVLYAFVRTHQIIYLSVCCISNENSTKIVPQVKVRRIGLWRQYIRDNNLL